MANAESRPELEIVYRPLADLSPFVGNARTHSKKQLAQIAASIEAFGFTNPVLVDEDAIVIAGHGRLLAAKSLGLARIPVIVLGGLTEAQKRALRLADNKIALNAGWDTEVLKIELDALADLSFELELTGFATGEIDVISADTPDPDDEVVPPTPDEPVTRPGDLWRLGEHRLLCGDSRDREVLGTVMGGWLADAAFTDPPYNVRIDGNAVSRGTHAEFAMASGEMTPAEFTAFLVQTLGACAVVSRDGAVHFVCMDHRHVGELTSAGDSVYGQRLNICVWNKSNAGMGSLYRSRHELVFVFRVGQAAAFNAVELGRHGRNRTNVWDYASVNSFRGSRREDLALHPTVKPVGLVADAIRDVTRKGERVLDAFMGSGTTLIAAERTRRICHGVEYEPRYVDVAIERWSAMTGRSAILERTGASFEKLKADALAAGTDQ
ncbi:MAG: ParB N-terminal domain-containing protein [Alphaproteobacteria bacterium]|nr:ParB N-terminal domain-containing protein [Alphaproteobacteria bacterium]MBU2377865.1 ParB N-terminal domain-containing protein [Alphaproteobacteria bacterium]